MNIGDSNKARNEFPPVRDVSRDVSAGPGQIQASGANARKVSGEEDSMGSVGREAKASSSAPTPAPKVPSSPAVTTAAPKDAHAAMDAEKASLVNQLIRGGTLADAA